MTLLERLHQLRQTFTKQEQMVAAYLEGGYPHSGLQSATETAKRTGTSAATVVRFIAKLGYKGYADFQQQLRDAIEAKLGAGVKRLDERLDINLPLKNDDVIKRTFEAAIAAITQTYSVVDPERLQAVAKLLLQCKGRILIVGGKRSWTPALYLKAGLSLLLEHVSTLSPDYGFSADELMDLSPEDVVVVFDLRRYAQFAARVAEWTVKHRATLIVLTDAPKSPLSSLTMYRLHAEATNIGIFDTLVGFVLIVDVLINLVSTLAPERSRRRLKLGEKAWNDFDIFWHEGAASAPQRQAQQRRASKTRSPPKLR